MTIRAKILLGFLILVVILAGQFGLNYYNSTKQAALAAQINRLNLATVEISRMSIEGQKMRRYEKELFIYVNNTEKRDKYIGEWREAEANLRLHLDALLRNASGLWSPDDKALGREWQSSLASYAAGMGVVADRILQGELADTVSANLAIADAKNAFRPFLNGTEQALETKLASSNELLSQYTEVQAQGRNMLIAAFGVGLLIAIVLVFIIPEPINRQVRALEKAMVEISKGSFQSKVPEVSSPELRQLAKSIERLRISMRGMLNRLSRRAV